MNTDKARDNMIHRMLNTDCTDNTDVEFDEWNEEDHPRAENGQFVKKGEGRTGNATVKEGNATSNKKSASFSSKSVSDKQAERDFWNLYDYCMHHYTKGGLDTYELEKKAGLSRDDHVFGFEGPISQTYRSKAIDYIKDKMGYDDEDIDEILRSYDKKGKRQSKSVKSVTNKRASDIRDALMDVLDHEGYEYDYIREITGLSDRALTGSNSKSAKKACSMLLDLLGKSDYTNEEIADMVEGLDADELDSLSN